MSIKINDILLINLEGKDCLLKVVDITPYIIRTEILSNIDSIWGHRGSFIGWTRPDLENRIIAKFKATEAVRILYEG